MTSDAMERREFKFLSLILLLSLIGPSRPPLWGQDAAPGTPPGTSAFFTTTDGVKLHYLDAGRGRAIVFVTGGTMSADIWEPQIREFSRDYRTIALDPRGHGRSEIASAGQGYEFPRLAADIRDLIEHLGLSNVVLVGWSMATLQVLTYVDRFGTDRLGALVLVDGAVWRPRASELCTSWVANFYDTARIESDSAWADSVFSQGTREMFTQPQREEYVRRVIEARRRMPRSVFAWIGAVSYCSPDTDKRAALTKLDRASTPLLYVISSPRFRLENADTVKGRIPSARVEVWDGAGHAPAADFPDRFNRLLREFLRGS